MNIDSKSTRRDFLIAKGPRLSYEDQLNSSRQFMRELNRLGVTSVIDAGGGWGISEEV